jgi:hypothetical protein
MESPNNAIIDEWGEYIVKSEDIIRIAGDEVLDGIQQNNPPIKAVEVAASSG